MQDADADRQFETVAERAPTMLWMGDKKGKCVYLNAAQRAFWGIELGSLDRFDWGETAHPDDRSILEATVVPAMTEGKEFQVEARFCRADGVYRTLRTKAQPRLSPEGDFLGMIGVNEDVTEQREAEQALLAQSRVSKILNTTGAAISAEIDLETLVQRVTDAAVALTGAKFGAFFYNVLNEEGESYLLYSLAGAPRSAFATYPMPRATAIFKPTFDGEGVIRSGDILQDPRYGLSEPHRGMPAGHLPVRSYLAVPVISRSGEVIGGLFFGHDEAEVFTREHEDLIVGLAGQAATAIDNARLFLAKEREIVARLQAETALKELNVSLEQRIGDEVRARLRAEEAMHQSQKMEAIGRLTGGIAHDFNNLLMAVLGSLELTKKRLGPNSQVAQLVDNAVAAAQRGATLTQRMLSFARRQPLNPGPCDVKELVEGMLELIMGSMGPAIKVTANFSPTLRRALVDKSQLEMALLNLAVNARDAMPDGGTIAISAWEQTIGRDSSSYLKAADYICLSFSDTGEGMDETTLAHATEPFFTTKGVGKGTGLGLPMVHGMAEQSGGRLILKSEKGHGTTAELWLPVAQVAGVELEVTVTTKPGPSVPLRILAVDDDRLVLFNTVMMLQEMGHSVAEAASASSALHLLEKENFDVVITDQAMPEMKGSELIAVIQKHWPKTRIIIATGFQELTDAIGSDVLRLAKPFSIEDLAHALHAVVTFNENSRSGA